MCVIAVNGSIVPGPGVINLFESKSCFLVQIHAKGYQFDTHTSEIKICLNYAINKN